MSRQSFATIRLHPAGENRTLRLRQIAGTFAAVTVVLAPLLFAGTRGWTADVLALLLWLSGGFWLAAVTIERKKLRLPLLFVATALGLIFLGALVTLLRPIFPDDPFMVNQIHVLREMMPGNFVAREPWRVWRFAVGALLGMLAVADLGRQRMWWNLFFEASAWAGLLAALLGLAQKMTKASAVWWDAATPTEPFFFSTFPHYTVAGSYLNLTWPLLFSLALGMWRSEGTSSFSRASFWICLLASGCCFFALGCLQSKAAQAFGVVLLIGFLGMIWQGSRRSLGRTGHGKWLLISLAGLGLGAIALFATQPIFEISRGRWVEFFAPTSAAAPPSSAPVVWDSSNRGDRLIESDSAIKGQLMWDRRLAWQTALRMIAARPLLGYGLGGWTPAYHHFTSDPFLKTFYLYLQFAHQSFLQWAVEWGLPGALGWVILLCGALYRGFHTLRKALPETEPAHRLKLWAILLALAILCCHACFEFPFEIPALLWQALVLAALLWVGTIEEKRSRKRRSSSPRMN